MTLIALFLPLTWIPLPDVLVFAVRYIAAAGLALVSWRHVPRASNVDFRPTKHVRWLLACLWGTLGLSVISCVWSINFQTTALQAVSLFFLCAIVHGLARGRWRSLERGASDLSVAAYVLGGLALAGLVAHVVGAGPSVGMFGRISGLYSNPNSAGLMAALGLAVLYPRWNRRRVWVNVLLALPLAVTLVLSESRTAVLGLVAASVFIVLSRARRLVLVAYSAALVLTLTALLFPRINLFTTSGVGLRFQEALESDDPLSGRGAAWWLALHAWQRERLTGYGYGTTREVFTEFSWLRPGIGAPNVHNSYLQWLLEFGLLGLPLLAAIILLLVVLAFRGGPYGPVVVAGIVIQITESAMLGTGQPYPYVYWLAVLLACISADSQQNPNASESRAWRRTTSEHQMAGMKEHSSRGID